MDKKISELNSHAESIINLLKQIDLEAKKTPEQIQDELPYRVIHLKENPTELAIRKSQAEFDLLKEENERLKVRLELLEGRNGGGNSCKTNSKGPMGNQGLSNRVDQIEELTRKVAELKERENKILASVAKTSREFREVCYLLTGYKLDVLKNRVYRLSHMYAEMEEDKLLFEITKEGMVQLLKNDYCDRLSAFIATYLENADSFPAFLASITLDLFKACSINRTMTF